MMFPRRAAHCAFVTLNSTTRNSTMSINKALLALAMGFALAACSNQDAATDAAADAADAAAEAQAQADAAYGEFEETAQAAADTAADAAEEAADVAEDAADIADEAQDAAEDAADEI